MPLLGSTATNSTRIRRRTARTQVYVIHAAIEVHCYQTAPHHTHCQDMEVYVIHMQLLGALLPTAPHHTHCHTQVYVIHMQLLGALLPFSYHITHTATHKCT